MNPGINAYSINNNENVTNTEINDNLFSNIDFGPLKEYLDDDNITDISYSNNGQVWLKSLDKGVYRVENPGINNELIEKIAFQCANIMGKTFNMASPFLDSESSELRMNFVHDSIARNGIAVVFRKTPAKIRLKKEKIIADKYITLGIHNFLIDAVRGHCNIIVSGETGSGKTELVKYLASHTAENEKIVTIEDTLELHLDKIFPTRDIVAMKTNNIASYSDVLVTCMRQNPKWILLSEVRSAEAVTAVRNSISSGHNILSTIHADKAESIPYRLYSLLESNIDVDQFMSTIYRYIQLGVHVRARYDKKTGKFMREVCEVCEFHVTHDNVPESHIIYRKNIDGTEIMNPPSEYLIDYLEAQGVDISNKDYSAITENNTDNSLSDVINDPKYSNENEVNEDKTNNDSNLGNDNVKDTQTNEIITDEIISDETANVVNTESNNSVQTESAQPVTPVVQTPNVIEPIIPNMEQNNSVNNESAQPVTPVVQTPNVIEPIIPNMEQNNSVNNENVQPVTPVVQTPNVIEPIIPNMEQNNSVNNESVQPVTPVVQTPNIVNVENLMPGNTIGTTNNTATNSVNPNNNDFYSGFYNSVQGSEIINNNEIL